MSYKIFLKNFKIYTYKKTTFNYFKLKDTLRNWINFNSCVPLADTSYKHLSTIQNLWTICDTKRYLCVAIVYLEHRACRILCVVKNGLRFERKIPAMSVLNPTCLFILKLLTSEKTYSQCNSFRWNSKFNCQFCKRVENNILIWVQPHLTGSTYLIFGTGFF